jgi:hypothetical protein
MTPEQVGERMTPAYAVRVPDALATEPASRAHDGVTVLQARC